MSSKGEGGPSDRQRGLERGLRATGQVAFLDQALWKRFAAAETSDAFLRSWLALQCRLIAGATSGVLVLGEPDQGPFAPAAIWPDSEPASPRLTKAVELAAAQRRSVIQGENSKAQAPQPEACLVAYPLVIQEQFHGVVGIELASPPPGGLRDVVRQLQWGASWIEVLLHRQRDEHEKHDRERAAMTLDMIAAALGQQGFKAACTAVVTELATRLNCDQVAIGFVSRGRCAVAAFSHAAQFSGRMDLIRNIGSTMDEAIDQECIILFPPSEGGKHNVTRAHSELMRAHDTGPVLTIPLGVEERLFGAITFVRPAGAGFDQPTVELCDCVAAVIGPLLEEKRRNDRLVIWKLSESVWQQIKRLFGPHYIERKLATAAILALGVFFSFAESDFRITSPATIEGLIQQSIVVPFDGYIASQGARAGETVRKGTVLASLDDKDLTLEHLRWSMTLSQRQTEYSRALALRNRADLNIIKAQIDQATAQIRLLDEQIIRTRLVAPFDGIVVSGDLSQSIGASVRRGEEVFKIAPLDSYRVILKVDESDITALQTGQAGQLLASSIPEEPLPYQIRAITPITESREGRNYFRVEAELREANLRLRPGMEGVAKTHVDRRLLIWTWTYKLTDWLRIKLWAWWP
jgi:RND family efflux transporter MFP subunit